MPELYDYQKKYLDGLPKNVLMTADVGLGKSAMALEHVKRHSVDSNGVFKQLVIVAPASKVRSGDWERDIRDWVPEIMRPPHDSDSVHVISYEKFTTAVNESPKF